MTRNQRKSMPYKLIATDLDGTMRVEGRKFSSRLKDAIRRAQACGCRVVIATGRMFGTAAPYAEELGIHGAIVCSNGATIYDIDQSKILAQTDMPIDLVRLVIEGASDDLAVIACMDEEFYIRRPSEEANRYVGNHSSHLHVLPNMKSLGLAPQKIVFANEESVTDSLFLELKLRFGRELQVVRSHPEYVELTHPDASKGNAVEWLANRWEIAQAQVIAVGDQDNDISMIRWAGLGIAVGNAVESVKSIANFIAPSADEDGVAVVIEKIILDDHG
jgi:Cof subfamily protein (haloacid dehalogenase superfamily)